MRLHTKPWCTTLRSEEGKTFRIVIRTDEATYTAFRQFANSNVKFKTYEDALKDLLRCKGIMIEKKFEVI